MGDSMGQGTDIPEDAYTGGAGIERDGRDDGEYEGEELCGSLEMLQRPAWPERRKVI